MGAVDRQSVPIDFVKQAIAVPCHGKEWTLNLGPSFGINSALLVDQYGEIQEQHAY